MNDRKVLNLMAPASVYRTAMRQRRSGRIELSSTEFAKEFLLYNQFFNLANADVGFFNVGSAWLPFLPTPAMNRVRCVAGVFV